MTHERRLRAALAAVFLTSVLLVLAGCGSSGDDSSGVAAGANLGTTWGTDPTAIPTSTTVKMLYQVLPEGDCVPFSDVLPDGAPEVPITPGPPSWDETVQDLQVGTGPIAYANSIVTVDYIGVACTTGKIFDETYSSGRPVTGEVNHVVPGWETMYGMRVGGRRLLIVPPDAWFDYKGSPPDVGKYETLYLVVDLKGVAETETGQVVPPG